MGPTLASVAEILGEAVFPEPRFPPPRSGHSPRTLPDGRRAGRESECVENAERVSRVAVTGASALAGPCDSL